MAPQSIVTSPEIESRYFSIVFERSIYDNPFTMTAEEMTSEFSYSQTAFFRRFGKKEKMYIDALRRSITIIAEENIFAPLDFLKDGRDESSFSREKGQGEVCYLLKSFFLDHFPSSVMAGALAPYHLEIKKEFGRIAPSLPSSTIDSLAQEYLEFRLTALRRKADGASQEDEIASRILARGIQIGFRFSLREAEREIHSRKKSRIKGVTQGHERKSAATH